MQGSIFAIPQLNFPLSAPSGKIEIAPIYAPKHDGSLEVYDDPNTRKSDSFPTEGLFELKLPPSLALIQKLYFAIPEVLKEFIVTVYGGYVVFYLEGDEISLSIIDDGSRSDCHHLIPQRKFREAKKQKKSNPIHGFLEDFILELILQCTYVREGHFLLNLFPVERHTHDFIEEIGFDVDGKSLDRSLEGIALYDILKYFTYFMILNQEKDMRLIIDDSKQLAKQLREVQAHPSKRRVKHEEANLYEQSADEILEVLNQKQKIVDNPDYQKVAKWLRKNGILADIEQ